MRLRVSGLAESRLQSLDFFLDRDPVLKDAKCEGAD